jgi:hypothetical protein
MSTAISVSNLVNEKGLAVVYGGFMVMILIIAVCSEAILLIIAGMSGHPLVRVDLFNMSGNVLLVNRWDRLGGAGIRDILSRHGDW